MESTGFVGLGTMGFPMARNVVKAGYRLSVFDIVDGPVQRLVGEGARGATSPRDAAEGSDVVITMLPTSTEVEAAVLGDDGVYAGLAPGTVHLEMSTIEPSATRRFASHAAKRAIQVLDAPVGKSSAAAAAGELTIMVGGPPEVFERCRPLLATMGSTIHHCGDVGAGDVVKLANNLLSGGILVLVAEAVVLAKKAGVDPEIVAEVMGGTAAANWHLDNTLRKNVLQGRFEPGFKTRLMHKDARLAVGMATELGVPVPASALIKELYAIAVARGLGDLDWGAYTTLVEEFAGVEVRTERASDAATSVTG
ncbi:MAG: NAD-binding protein [Chloroflexi bacterium]|nr:NAD-binding protein [Chloroflexota bacterium]